MSETKAIYYLCLACFVMGQRGESQQFFDDFVKNQLGLEHEEMESQE